MSSPGAGVAAFSHGRLVGTGLLLLVVLAAAVSSFVDGRRRDVTAAPPTAIAPAVAASPPPAAAGVRSSPEATAAARVSSPTPVGAAGVYREAIVGQPVTLNPLLAVSDAEQDVARLLFAGLTRTDGRGGVQPDLAERWSIDEGGKVYTFSLRPGAAWHNGKPVTAGDVLFTVRLIQDASFPGDRALSAFWSTIRVDVVDARTVRFTLNEPYAPFLSRAGFPLLPAEVLHGVYPSDLAGHDFSRQPIGAGPYRLAEPVRGGALLLERFAGYHGSAPGIERIMLRFYPDGEQAVAALRRAEVDGVGGVPADRLEELRRVPNVQVHSLPLNGYAMLVLNLRRPLFQQRELRQGLALAIDRPALVAEALDGAAEPGSGPVVPSSWAYRAAPPGGTIHEARALLEAGGWLDADGDGLREREGRPLSFTLVTSDSAERTRAATVIARQLQAVGVRVSIVTVPAAEVLGRYLAPRDFDAVLFGWAALGDDPDPYGLWHSSQAETGHNFAGWSAPRVDELLESGRQATEQGRRAATYAEFQRLFQEEMPSIILYYPRYVFATGDHVQPRDPGPVDRPADRFRSIGDWRLRESRAVGLREEVAGGG